VKIHTILIILGIAVPISSCVTEMFGRVDENSNDFDPICEYSHNSNTLIIGIAVPTSSCAIEIFDRADESSDDANTLGIAVLLASSCAIEIYDRADDNSDDFDTLGIPVTLAVCSLQF
jgi:hypothetical protein